MKVCYEAAVPDVAIEARGWGGGHKEEMPV
jgi:hypothetical protein